MNRKFIIKGLIKKKDVIYIQTSAIHKDRSNKMRHCIKFFIIPYLYEAQRVVGDTPPIIRSLKLHWQPLVFYTWKVVGRAVGGPCQAHCA
jgi:hypothetical protein